MHQPLIESLKSPAAWPHPVSDVELCETHISWVLLTGEFAYKIKKPVNFGFLDFSTLERRKHFCEEEVRLNGRFSPDLYLGVVPIVRAGESQEFRVEGEGQAVEYAVRMRQFPQEALLSRLFQQGLLTREDVDTLAKEVAAFHARADRTTPRSPFGTPEGVLWPIVQCYEKAFEGEDPAGQRWLEEIRDWVAAEHARRTPLLENRRREGFVRECHGDMHLGNMLLESGQVRLFDGIEFSESLRWIDVMSEVAFTAMDLTDQPFLSARFLNAYLEHTGDYEGMGLERFYSVYRALVRAKVAGIRRSEPDVEEPEQKRLFLERRTYLSLARGSVQPAWGRPRLILTHGLSGSGKSTWTQPLLENLPAIRVRSDVERKRLAGLQAGSRSGSSLDSGLYTADRTAATYDRLLQCAGQILDGGWNAIVDATLLSAAQRDRFRQLAGTINAGFAILDFQAPEAVLRERIARREAAGGDPSEATLAVLDQQIRSRDPLSGDEQQSAVAVDTTSPVTPEILETIESRLRQLY